MKTIQIDLEKIEAAKTNSGDIFLTPGGEETLVQLLEIQKQVEEAIDKAKKTLETSALAMDPNFRSIQADKIKVYYRSYGQRYYIDEAQVNLAPKELYTAETKTVYKVDTKAVEKWVKEKNGMPVGITEVERAKQLTFSLKSEVKDDN